MKEIKMTIYEQDPEKEIGYISLTIEKKTISLKMNIKRNKNDKIEKEMLSLLNQTILLLNRNKFKVNQK